MQAVRLTKAKYQDTAMTGQGASLEGGRWNPPGMPLVYCASTLSLAILEVLVHTRRMATLLPVYCQFQVTVADAAITTLDPATLPPDWIRNEPACASAGLAWASGMASVAWRVPSAVVPAEWNLVLNPRHPGFAAAVTWTGPLPATFDVRLLR